MNIIAFIFARGGSKGLPGKNIRPLAGKPLIAWAIEQAQAVKRIDRIIVSTDSDEIATIARTCGAEVPFMRPAELARDDTPEWLAWRHALGFIRNQQGCLPDVMVSVPVTAPLRLPVDIERCLDEYLKGDVDAVITVTEAHHNPCFNMVKQNSDGTVGLVMPLTNGISRRQDAPIVYDMATVAYAVNPVFVMTQTELFAGRIKTVQIPAERAIDIDNGLDFQIAEFLMAQQKRAVSQNDHD
jgi:N-acylneuraminate cytidylyltransferase